VISFLDVNVGGKALHAHPMLFFDCLENKKIKTKQKSQKTLNCHLVVFFPNAKGNALNNQPNAFFFSKA
jgi:hypothetical protein